MEPVSVSPVQEIHVPDLGDFTDVEVVEVLVRPGDQVTREQPLITLETDKAAMDVPSPVAGRVESLHVEAGDKVSEGSSIASVAVEEAGAGGDDGAADAGGTVERSVSTPSAAQATASAGQGGEASAGQPVPSPTAEPATPDATAPGGREGAARPTSPRDPAAEPARPKPPPVTPVAPAEGPLPHASPAVRKFARHLGVDLTGVSGSGPKGRIVKADVEAYVQSRLQGSGSPAAPTPAAPQPDFEQFGPVEQQPLSRIQRRAGPHLHQSWSTIPHVTQFDEADITGLEAFRSAQQAEGPADGPRLTLLPFVLRACAAALREHPRVNSSLAQDGGSLIIKRYVHIGVAVDTGDGLVVPVVRDVDTKGVRALAAEIADVAQRARNGRLAPDDLQGGSFTVSNLGGLAGTGFTPIINAPEAAILGVSPARYQPVYVDGAFQPRLMLPLSLSYDHRIVDGAEGARFAHRVAVLLADLRRVLM